MSSVRDLPFPPSFTLRSRFSWFDNVELYVCWGVVQWKTLNGETRTVQQAYDDSSYTRHSRVFHWFFVRVSLALTSFKIIQLHGNWVSQTIYDLVYANSPTTSRRTTSTRYFVARKANERRWTLQRCARVLETRQSRTQPPWMESFTHEEMAAHVRQRQGIGVIRGWRAPEYKWTCSLAGHVISCTSSIRRAQAVGRISPRFSTDETLSKYDRRKCCE